jgi:hypothetical protein
MNENKTTTYRTRTASSMCQTCYKFLDPDGYCKKCRTHQPSSEDSKLGESQQSADNTVTSSTTQEQQSTRLLEQSLESMRTLKTLAQSQLDASNRTTHAVRALTIFIVNIFTFTLIGSFCVWVGTYWGQDWLMIFGYVFTFAGIGGSIQLSIRELRKSDR